MPGKKKFERVDGRGLSEVNAGVAVGLVSGLFLFLVGLSAVFLSYGNLCVLVLGSMLLGFDASIAGSFVGLFWGFVWGFIIAYLVVWVYNRL